MRLTPSPSRLRVAILDDHPSTIDGYRFQLGQAPDLEIVGAAYHGQALEALLAAQRVDVLLLDIGVPTAADNPNPYPILTHLPHLLQVYPDLAVVVISMHAESSLIKSMMRAGAVGYILKDDHQLLQNLAAAVRAAAHGDITLSQQARHQWERRSQETGAPLTPRQLQALALCAAYPDEATAALAARLTVAPSSLRNLLSGAYLRLGVSSRAGAVAEARRRGLITPFAPPPPDAGQDAAR